jgi:hypothetical protein
MEKADVLKAVEIMLDNHSNNISINKLAKGDSFVPNAAKLVIHDCVPAVVNKLKEAGFMLSMSSVHNGMLVEKI